MGRSTSRQSLTPFFAAFLALSMEASGEEVEGEGASSAGSRIAALTKLAIGVNSEGSGPAGSSVRLVGLKWG